MSKKSWLIAMVFLVGNCLAQSSVKSVNNSNRSKLKIKYKPTLKFKSFYHSNIDSISNQIRNGSNLAANYQDINANLQLREKYGPLKGITDLSLRSLIELNTPGSINNNGVESESSSDRIKDGSLSLKQSIVFPKLGSHTFGVAGKLEQVKGYKREYNFEDGDEEKFEVVIQDASAYEVGVLDRHKWTKSFISIYSYQLIVKDYTDDYTVFLDDEENDFFVHQYKIDNALKITSNLKFKANLMYAQKTYAQRRALDREGSLMSLDGYQSEVDRTYTLRTLALDRYSFSPSMMLKNEKIKLDIALPYERQVDKVYGADTYTRFTQKVSMSYEFFPKRNILFSSGQSTRTFDHQTDDIEKNGDKLVENRKSFGLGLSLKEVFRKKDQLSLNYENVAMRSNRKLAEYDASQVALNLSFAL
ncbi:hypothetical protein N9N67_11555 [Bacteriovoracaceae bacterium]|nr:hypothetical protein [Bacteriovoracaceae bacterium]